MQLLPGCPTFSLSPTGSTTQNKVGALRDKTLTLNYATLNILRASTKAKLVRWTIYMQEIISCIMHVRRRADARE
jgi:hypothetical protein